MESIIKRWELIIHIIHLDSRGSWNGTSNIILETVHNAGNSGNGATTTVKYTTTPTNTVYYGASDSVSGGIAGFTCMGIAII